LHCGIDVGRLAARDLIEHLPVRWVKHINGLPGQGGQRLVGDEVVLHAAIVGGGAALEITKETSHTPAKPEPSLSQAP
jgi:hypothetical protein